MKKLFFTLVLVFVGVLFAQKTNAYTLPKKDVIVRPANVEVEVFVHGGYMWTYVYLNGSLIGYSVEEV